VPKAAIDSEIDALRKQLAQQYGGSEELAANLPAEMFEEQATRRVKLGLLIGSYINQKELTASEEDIDAQLQELASVYEQPEEVIEWYKSDKSRLSQIEQLVLEDKVVDSILAQANVVEKPATFKEIMNPKG
jgi:trigger factor